MSNSTGITRLVLDVINASVDLAGRYNFSFTLEDPKGDHHRVVTQIKVESITTTAVGQSFSVECRFDKEVLSAKIITPSNEK